jgi:hypothetical protein
MSGEIIEFDAVPAVGPDAELPVADALIDLYVPTRKCRCCAFYASCATEKAGKAQALQETCHRFTWTVGLDDYQQRGIILGEYVRAAGIALGSLVEWGWAELRPTLTWNGKEIEQATDWCAFSAMLWGFSRPTVVKAWGVWKVRRDAEIPPDVLPSRAYELASGGLKGAELEAVLGKAIDEHWSAWDAREIKALVKAGLLATWERIALVRIGDALCYEVGGERVRFATLDGGGRGEIGTRLLMSRARIREEGDDVHRE